jgi:hypothetical protein
MTSSPQTPQADRRTGSPSALASWRHAVTGWPRSLSSQEGILLLGVFLVNLILVAPDLMIGFASINPYDEAKYIDSGRSLLAGDLRQLSWGPLVALIYAPFALLRNISPDWFLLSAWGGRFVLYALIWWSTLTLARRLWPEAQSLVVASVLFVSLHFFPLLDNSSDATFTICSALALAKLLDFRASHRLADAFMGSALCGLAMLARAEAGLLLAMYVVLVILVVLRRGPRLRVVAAAILPAAFVLVGYLAISWLSMGRVELDMGSKSYDSFEVNQPLASGTDREASRAETRRLFGTPEENQHSVVRAVLRNPPAFARRVGVRVLGLPRQFLELNGKRLGAMLALFAAWGIFALVRRRGWQILAILAAWAAPSAVALAFLPRHVLLQTSFLIVILAAMGAGYVAEPGQPAARRWTAMASALALLLLGWVGNLPAILAAGFLVATCLILAWRLAILASPQVAHVAALLLLLTTGVLLRGEYPFPDFPTPGVTAEEHAVHQMQQTFPPGAHIAVSVPLPALAAGMQPVDLDGPQDAPSFGTWLAANSIDGVYIGPGASDSSLRETISAAIDSSLAIEYEEGDVILTRTIPR